MALRPTELEPDPDDTDVPREEAPEEDPPELELDPPRDVADPLLLLDDEEDGVRDPAGVWGISTTRAGSGALEVAPPPEEPDEPDEPDPELVGRGIAWAYEAAGTASAIARAATTSERGFLSMTMHSFNGS